MVRCKNINLLMTESNYVSKNDSCMAYRFLVHPSRRVLVELTYSLSSRMAYCGGGAIEVVSQSAVVCRNEVEVFRSICASVAKEPLYATVSCSLIALFIMNRSPETTVFYTPTKQYNCRRGLRHHHPRRIHAPQRRRSLMPPNAHTH